MAVAFPHPNIEGVKHCFAFVGDSVHNSLHRRS